MHLPGSAPCRGQSNATHHPQLRLLCKHRSCHPSSPPSSPVKASLSCHPHLARRQQLLAPVCTRGICPASLAHVPACPTAAPHHTLPRTMLPCPPSCVVFLHESPLPPHLRRHGGRHVPSPAEPLAPSIPPPPTATPLPLALRHLLHPAPHHRRHKDNYVTMHRLLVSASKMSAMCRYRPSNHHYATPILPPLLHIITMMMHCGSGGSDPTRPGISASVPHIPSTVMMKHEESLSHTSCQPHLPSFRLYEAEGIPWELSQGARISWSSVLRSSASPPLSVQSEELCRCILLSFERTCTSEDPCIGALSMEGHVPDGYVQHIKDGGLA